MVVVQARQLNLPPHHHHHHRHSFPLSSPTTTSLLFDPTSLSLALMHSDSSFSLYPSLSPLFLSSSSSSPSPPPHTIIPPPSSSATFLRLHNQIPNSTPRVLFLVSSPVLGGASVLLRFWILNTTTQSFSRARVICNQTDLTFENDKFGLVFRINHGVAIKLIGSINVFAMYSISNAKIWVFAVKMAGDDEDGVTLKLMKCAVIDCSLPVFSISVSLGFLILGEQSGVRVFPLRPLVKGRIKKHHHHHHHHHRRVNKDLYNGLDNDKLEDNQLDLSNAGLTRPINGSADFRGNSMAYSNGGVTTRGNHLDSAKLKSIKLRQESKEGGGCFVPFMSKEVDCKCVQLKTVKAISIQVLSPYKFLILDSVGDLHLLCLSNPVFGSEIHHQMKKLILSMKVHNLAVLHDISTRAQTVWLSDGHHTVHTMVLGDVDSSEGESESKDNEEKLIQNSVIQAIFTSEKIQEIIPFAANTILILGQANSIFAYAIS